MKYVFNSPSKPFYQSAISIRLEPIALSTYSVFVTQLFEMRYKQLLSLVCFI